MSSKKHAVSIRVSEYDEERVRFWMVGNGFGAISHAIMALARKGLEADGYDAARMAELRAAYGKK